MNRLRKWWRLALVLVVVVAAAQIGASLLARTHRVHQNLVMHLERAFGRSVEVRHFTVLLLPSPVLDAEQVTIGEDPSFGNEYFLRAEHLTAGLRWSGLLRGHFEFGTLSLTRPSLILVRNEQGNWNLERWLPPGKTVGDTSRVYGPQSPTTPSNHLEKIEIDDGRINFKLLDEKLPFAFLGVSGSIEQVSTGRWKLALEAQPWRSGVTLQSAGTLVARGDVAGTSARLQPAEVHVHWDKVSLADLFRLFRGQDYGLRGVFTLDGIARSETAEGAAPDPQPGDWNFSVHARASQIHRWDLNERSDNPGANLNLEGRWNTVARDATIERLAIETTGSNLRGSARFTPKTAPSWQVRVESAGVQAADLLTWYRAFDPNVNEAIRAEQFFTGSVTLSGWPVELHDAAFSSFGGEVRVPGLSSVLRVGPFQGGRGRSELSVTPIRVSFTPLEGAASSASLPPPRRRAAGESKSAVDIGFVHDLEKRAGSASFDGHTERIEDVLKVLAAFGHPINRGWELTGAATAALHYQWDIAQTNPRWNGHVDFNKGTLQAAGMNQPLQVNKARVDWHDGLRTASILDVDGFGTNWTGKLAQANAPDSDGGVKWNVQLHADHLDAAELDRWIGPRARPSWLQRLLSSLLGSANASPAASELVRRVNAEGEVRVDEFTLEKIKLTQVRAEGVLHDLHLELRQADAQWAGGNLRARMRAAFLPRPSYDVSADLDRVDLAQLPAPANLPDRLAGLASGSVHLTTQGVGREELLQRLAGKGEVRLRDAEFRGWDVSASMADGAPREGASRWESGQGAFTIHDRSISLPGLRLDSGSELTLIKGNVSFARESDLTLQTLLHEQSDSRLPEQGYVLKISGPLDLPRVSIERLIARRPAD